MSVAHKLMRDTFSGVHSYNSRTGHLISWLHLSKVMVCGSITALISKKKKILPVCVSGSV